MKVKNIYLYFISHPASHVLYPVILAACVVLNLCVTVATAASRVDDKPRSRAERALREGEFEVAEKLFRALLAKDARDVDARLGLSLALLKQRKLRDAFDHAARVIAVDPLSPRAHALLGTAVLASGDFRLSVEEFRTALSIKDDEAMAIAGLAMVDFYENRLSDCLSGLRRALFLEPNEPDYIFSLAQAAARSERYKEAANAYERFLAVAPLTDSDRRARIRGMIDFLRYLGTQKALYAPTGATRVTVPYEEEDNRPIIQVRVNGTREPLRFVLDTGSGMCVISNETAQRLGVHTIARGGMARAVGGGGRFEIAYGFLTSLDIGEARVERVPVYIRRFFDEKKPVDGYIGLAAISKFIATVDYGEHTFSLSRQRENKNSLTEQTPQGIEIPLRSTSSGFLSGEVRLDGVKSPLNFIIDTGASISVVSTSVAAVEELSGFAQTTRMRVYGAAGVADDVSMLLLPRITFGSYARDNVSAAVLDLDPVNETSGFVQNGILGGNFLRHFRLIFDFKRSIVRLEPLAARAPERAGPTQRVGATGKQP